VWFIPGAASVRFGALAGQFPPTSRSFPMTQQRLETLVRTAVAGLALTATGACNCPPKPSAQAPAPAPAATVEAAPAAAAPAPASEPPKCAGQWVVAADGVIDDAEDNNNAIAVLGGRDGKWSGGKDDKGTTLFPEGEVKMAPGGANGSKFAARFWGKRATGDGAWGTNFGARFKDGGSFDASKHAGISFFAKTGKGSTQNFRFRISDVNTHPDGAACKQCWNHFGRELSISDQWTEFKVSFDEMTQEEYWGDPRPPKITPSKVYGFEFAPTTAGADFDISIDDIKFIDCK
jgi:hypothetical protein